MSSRGREYLSSIEFHKLVPFPEVKYNRITLPHIYFDKLLDSYRENKLHLFMELTLCILIFYVVFSSVEKDDLMELSKNERSEIINSWCPDSLTPNVSILKKSLVNITTNVGPFIQTDHHETFLNFISFNYLGFSSHSEVLITGVETIKKYAVGSCGPRGFYGTMDIHLNFEKKIAKMLSTKQYPVDCVLYADYLGCPASVITAYAKKNDLIIADRKVNWLFKQGFLMSRAKVIYFKHNDMNDLELTLQRIQDKNSQDPYFKLNRRFIVTEGVFVNSGKIVNLPRLLKLKNQYKYRLILDDSHGFGTIARFGTPDFFGRKTGEIDIYICSLDTSFSTIGAFVVGNKEISEHQRLSSFGYVFSASGPPFQIKVASRAIDLISFQIVIKLKSNINSLYHLLQGNLDFFYTESNSNSPILFLYLKNNRNKFGILKQIYEYCLQRGILLFNTTNLPKEKFNFPQGIRLTITAQHMDEHLHTVAAVLKEAETKFLLKHSN